VFILYTQRRSTGDHSIGISRAKRSVNPRPANPNDAVKIVHVVRVSVSVSTLILEKIQKPLLFIQSPTSDPLPIAIAR
jgi:hypothetical protein